MKLKLYLSREQALIVQNYDSLALIVQQAFGASPKPTSSTPEPGVKIASTKAEMEAAMKGHF